MPDGNADSKGTCRVAAVVSGVVLLLAVIVAQHHVLATRRVLMPEFQRLQPTLPVPTMALVANYPASFGYLAIALSALWLVATLFLRRGTVPVVVNCVLLLAVIGFLVLHGWAAVLPYVTVGRSLS